MRKNVQIAGFPIRKTTTRVVTRFLLSKLGRRQRAIVLFFNSNFANKCRHLRREIAESPDIVLLNDGIAVDIAAAFCAGVRFPENLNGTDFTPVLLSALDKRRRVFLLGARVEVIQEAAKALRRLYQFEICGVMDGFSFHDDELGLNQRINAAKPDVLLVGMGNPRQEEWVLRNRGALEVPLILAVGAFFDFVSGHIPRAPLVLRRLRLEWAYRLFREPSRLIYRYTVGIIVFFFMALFDQRSR